MWKIHIAFVWDIHLAFVWQGHLVFLQRYRLYEFPIHHIYMCIKRGRLCNFAANSVGTCVIISQVFAVKGQLTFPETNQIKFSSKFSSKYNKANLL